YQQVKSNEVNRFLFFPPVEGLDGAKVAALSAEGSAESTAASAAIAQATSYGRQRALKITAGIPATMAVGYLILLVYFRAIGGYKLVEIGPSGNKGGKRHRP